MALHIMAAPQVADRDPQDAGAAKAVGHDPERQAGQGGDQRTDRDQQTDVGIADVQSGPQGAGRSPDGRRVGTAQGQNGSQRQDDPGPLLAPSVR